MRARVILGLTLIYLIASINPANATGYISWSAENGKASNFSQEISINSANIETAWKAQVTISPEMLFGIVLAQRNRGVFEVEFGTYFGRGSVRPIPAPNATCFFYAASGDQKNFSNCRISVQLSLPAKVRYTIRQDSSDLTGKTWDGYFGNVTTGEEYLIAKFDVGEANLGIQDVFEFTYPYGINECQTTPAIQEATWWRPVSTNSKYNLSSTSQTACGTVTFFISQSYTNTDGILIRLNTQKNETRTYKDSVFEILYPEVWGTAYALATTAAKEESTKAYTSLQTASEQSISQLQAQIVALNQSLKKLQSQVKKICGAKKKPIGC